MANALPPVSCKFPLCPGSQPGACLGCPDKKSIADHVAETVSKTVHAYQIARKVEDLAVDAAAIRPTRREIAIAITHLETAAMFLNKAHYAAKKE